MRLFIAINFHEITKEKLLAVQRKIKACGTGNFSRPENLHLTVLFLGEVLDYSAVIKSIDTYFHTPIELTFDKVGKFKSNLYWVGLRRNTILEELYYKIGTDLKKAGYRVDYIEHFNPHITLAREVVLSSPVDLSFQEFSMSARRISLMKSEQLGGKLTYTEVYGKSI